MVKKARSRYQSAPKRWYHSPELISIQSCQSHGNSEDSLLCRKSSRNRGPQEPYQLSSLHEQHLYSSRQGLKFEEQVKVENSSTDAYSSECSSKPLKPPHMYTLIEKHYPNIVQMPKEDKNNLQVQISKDQIQTKNKTWRQSNFVKLYMQKPFRRLKDQIPSDQFTALGLRNKVTTFKHVFDQSLRIKLNSDHWILFQRFLIQHLDQLDSSKFKNLCDKIRQQSACINEENYQDAFKLHYNHVSKRWRPHYYTFKARMTRLHPTLLPPKQMITRSQKRTKKL